MIIKCKMCGGDIDFIPGATYGTCEYCGSVSTIPKAEDEGKLNRYNRANHFRRQGEFDKAAAAYEKILEQDDTDAEAHWGVVISRYGIEYVEDPATGKRVPTCHRLQLTSILSDEDYKAAVEYAPDDESRRIYREEGARIAEIQRGILAISQNEKPYDVFICYKETDENGQRTHDSQWAQDVYYGLTEQGYKVFFSRITLEDKLGQEYEPYIFAALNSAKVMVVIGSKPEYFSAVWVRNEWSRYLKLMANDRGRLLIPCYRGMDPYDLPDELSSLQSQDMGKIGFMQDLIRGVKKVLDADKKAGSSVTARQAAPAASADIAAPGVASLMKRAQLFMEDGDFRSASEYLDRVLDIDPEYAPAYAAKACVKFGMCRESELAEATFLYNDDPDWKKALRFADPGQKKTYEEYAAKAKERVDRQIRDYAYDCAMEMAVSPKADREKLDRELERYRETCARSQGDRADGKRRANSEHNEKIFRQTVRNNDPGYVTEQGFKTAAEMFDSVGDKDASECAKQCRALAEQARQKAVYDSAEQKQRSGLNDPAILEDAAKIFQTIPSYRDAKAKAKECFESAESIRSYQYNEVMKQIKNAGEDSRKWSNVKSALAKWELNGYRDVEQLREKADKRYEECLSAENEEKRRAEEAAAVKKLRDTILAILVPVLIIAAIILVTKVIIPGNNYRAAVALQQAGRYEEAITAFEELNGYSDSAAQIEACRNSIKERDYNAAIALQQAGKYEEAIAAFEALNGYGDSAVQIEACRNSIKERDYNAAIALQQAGKYEEAIAAFEALDGYGDSAAQIEVCRNSIKERDYKAAVALQQAGRYEEAIEEFTTLGNYSDAAVQITETRYLKAKNLASKGDYAGAAVIFIGIKGYKDVDSLLANAQNLMAVAAAAERDAKFGLGNYVTFGTYPQTASGNDSTPIEWLVLARDGQKALLISQYALDCHPYNTGWTSVTWETCTLRTWLNGTFLNKAFTAREQTAIVLTKVDNGAGQGYSGWNTSGGKDTEDRVFLLSYAEAWGYFKSDSALECKPTEYAVAQGAPYNAYNGNCKWWLRSSGRDSSSACNVNSYGARYNYDIVDDGYTAVRPALWVNLESGIF